MKLAVTIPVAAVVALCGAALFFAATPKTGMTPTPGDLYDSLCVEQQEADDARKDVLAIGDSISVGYTPFLRELLPQYDVVHPSCNCTTSINGVTTINQWLSLRQGWEIAIFNHGLWDIVPFYSIPVDVYKSAIKIEGLKLKSKVKKVFFVTTTFVPDGAPNRDNRNAMVYNAAAKEVMSEIGIPIIDLYSASKSIHREHSAGPSDVHYTPDGYKKLAAHIAGKISP